MKARCTLITCCGESEKDACCSESSPCKASTRESAVASTRACVPLDLWDTREVLREMLSRERSLGKRFELPLTKR